MNTNPARSEHPSGRSLAHYLPHAARIFMGVAFLVFGLNGFLRFMPEPDPSKMPADMLTFLAGLKASHYLMPMASGCQLAVGVLLLLNRFVPLALAVIAPQIVNIFLIHVFLERTGLPIAIIISALEVYLAWSYRHAFRPMLAARVNPGRP